MCLLPYISREREVELGVRKGDRSGGPRFVSSPLLTDIYGEGRTILTLMTPHVPKLRHLRWLRLVRFYFDFIFVFLFVL